MRSSHASSPHWFPWTTTRVDGKERWESLRTTSLNQAEKKLAVIEDRVGRGAYHAADARRLRFKDLESFVLTDCKARKLRSLPRLNTALKHLRETFGTMRALGITTDKITPYEVERLDSGASRASVNYELATLRRMFRLAVRAKRLPSAPAITIHDPKNARMGYFERADFDAVLEALPEYLRPVMRFAYPTGWRVKSEVLRLTWDRVDRERGSIRLDPGTTKNDEGRELPYTALSELAALITAQHQATKSLERATGRIIPSVFHRHGAPIKSYKERVGTRHRAREAARANRSHRSCDRDSSAGSSTTSVGRRCATWSRPACRAPSP